MKKVCFVFVLLLVGSVASAQTRMVRLTRYEGRSITGVSASGAFDVRLIRSDETRAVVEIDERHEPMLRFEIDTCGVVHVGMDGGVRIDSRHAKRRLYVYLSDLAYIRASALRTWIAPDFSRAATCGSNWAERPIWAGSSLPQRRRERRSRRVERYRRLGSLP